MAKLLSTKILKWTLDSLHDNIRRLDRVLHNSDDLTEKELYSLREAHDHLANARDIIQRVLKEKTPDL